MTNPLISIIVPIYNAEKYLSKCLDSIIAQTFEGWECILVNDASLDGGGEIILSYAQKDSRFKVITKTVNEGVSKARQTGLENSCGKYVIHADPDDTVDKNWLQELYHTAESEQADITICDFERIYASKTVTCCQKPSSLNNEDILEDLVYERIWGVSWNKLIRRECFVKWNISFHPEMDMWEDLYVTCKLLMCGAKVAYVPKELYYYDSKTNPNSFVNHTKYEHVRSMMIFVDEISHILIQPRYDEGWYKIKKKIKELLFQFNASQDEIINTYKEVNTRLVSEGKSSKALSYNYCLALAIDGHTKLAHLLYKVGILISRCLYCIKNR